MNKLRQSRERSAIVGLVLKKAGDVGDTRIKFQNDWSEIVANDVEKVGKTKELMARVGEEMSSTERSGATLPMKLGDTPSE